MRFQCARSRGIRYWHKCVDDPASFDGEPAKGVYLLSFKFQFVSVSTDNDLQNQLRKILVATQENQVDLWRNCSSRCSILLSIAAIGRTIVVATPVWMTVIHRKHVQSEF